mgnify:FL=1|tara:strand:+ start:614 stop:1345 length:732 start_codon:yes stop_codon:yes gene_type:complete
MKKLIISILMLSGIFTMASAEVGVKLGVTAQIGELTTSGKETSSAAGGATETSANEKALFGTAGFFIEKDLAFLPGPFGRLSVGYDNIAHDLDLGTQTNSRSGLTTALNTDVSLGAGGTKAIGNAESPDNSLNAKITGFSTVYATLAITDWLYVKAGTVEVDVKTKFTGTSTSSYAENHSLDGNVWGFGVESMNDNGLFFRLEYNDYDIDGKSVVNAGTDSTFTATLNEVTGNTTRVSVGKSF